MKKWFIIASFVTVGLIVSYHGLKPHQLFSTNHNTSAQMNFYLNNIESRKFSDDGKLTQILTTKKAFQNANQSSITLDTINIEVGLGDNRWNVSAASGTTDAELKKITLQNSVKLFQINGTAEIFTEMLTLDSEQEIAYTDLAIKILLNGSETNATGLHVDLKQETIQLKNNVKTTYDPKNNRANSTRSNS